MSTSTYLIWSVEQEARWRAGRRGYSCTLAHAGRYSREEAERIVADANRVKVSDCMIPLSAIEPLHHLRGKDRWRSQAS